MAEHPCKVFKFTLRSLSSGWWERKQQIKWESCFLIKDILRNRCGTWIQRGMKAKGMQALKTDGIGLPESGNDVGEKTGEDERFDA